MNLLYILGNTDAGDISVTWEEMTGQRLDLSLKEWQALAFSIIRFKNMTTNKSDNRYWSTSKSKSKSNFRFKSGSNFTSTSRSISKTGQKYRSMSKSRFMYQNTSRSRSRYRSWTISRSYYGANYE